MHGNRFFVDRTMMCRWLCVRCSGVTERLRALGHIDTRGPFTMSPVTLMSV